MRKTFLLGGVILLLASGSMAGQRTRGGDSVRGGGADSVAAPQAQEISSGVVSRTVGGLTVEADQANNIKLEDILAVHGSVDAWRAVQILSGIDSMPNGDETILGNNSVILLDGYASPSVLPLTIERHKLSVDSMDTLVNGETVTTFVDNTVGLDTDMRSPWLSRTGMPSVTDGDGEKYADGAVVFEP
jgi:hypothetical protein